MDDRDRPADMQKAAQELYASSCTAVKMNATEEMHYIDSHAGGISECKKIAAMWEAFDVAVAPHCPLGPIALAACVQLDSCTPNAFIQEQSLGIHYNKGGDLLDYLVDSGVFRFQDGYIQIPQGLGLGIEVDREKVLAAAKIGHNWKSPIWRNYDGTVAEW